MPDDSVVQPSTLTDAAALAPGPLPVIPLAYGTGERMMPDEAIEPRVIGKVMRRLIPFMVLLYILNYLDRANVSVAKLQMNDDLHLGNEVYGFGAGVFFVGYFLFEVPSNLLMERFGARRWMARIMMTWGLTSSAMMFVTGKWSFFSLRLLLGVAEAGFFPGMILYMTYWIPARERSRAAALFLTSTALSVVIGSPLAGLLMRIHGLGLHGWQWLFLLEGIPSVIMGVVILKVLDDRPEQATWLTTPERDWLAARLLAERGGRPVEGHRISHAFSDGRVWLLAALYGTLMFGFNGMIYWTASIVSDEVHADPLTVGALSAIPFVAASVGMVIIARYADRTGRRRETVFVCAIVGAAGLATAAACHAPSLSIGALCVAAVGIWGALGPFWALPSRFLHGSAAAAGIAFINSIGNLFGGFVGLWVMGKIKDTYHSYALGLLLDAFILVGAAGLVWVLSTIARREQAAERPGFEIAIEAAREPRP